MVASPMTCGRSVVAVMCASAVYETGDARKRLFASFIRALRHLERVGRLPQAVDAPAVNSAAASA